MVELFDWCVTPDAELVYGLSGPRQDWSASMRFTQYGNTLIGNGIPLCEFDTQDFLKND